MARACRLVGDFTGARVVAEEIETYLASQTDATGWQQRLAEITRQLKAARFVLPVGPTSLTAAELRVLHLLPTNLSIADIGRRL